MRVGSPLWMSALVAGSVFLDSTAMSRSARPASGQLASGHPAPDSGQHQSEPARVSGRIAAPNGRQLLSGAVMLVPLATPATAVPVADTAIASDGLFLFRNVLPGRYEIRSLGEVDRQGPSLYGTVPVTVGRENADGIIIMLTPGAIVEGRLEQEGSGSLPLRGDSRPRVRAVAADGNQFGDALSEPIGRDGRFRFRGIRPGEHTFRAEGLPASWVLRAVYLEGREVTGVPITLRSSQHLQNLRVVVTDRPQDLPFEVRAVPTGGAGPAVSRP